MAKYRKRPIAVQAVQWIDWSRPPGGVARSQHYHGIGCVDTPDGQMECRIGDWIIVDANGEVYPCKPDIFDLTYEFVDEPEEKPNADTP